MIEVKEAVSAAIEAVNNFYGKDKTTGIQLEEVEMNENGKTWLITLSFYVHNSIAMSTLSQMLQTASGQERKYKIFEIDIITGKVTAMRIRNNA
jgi:hypothetical protein